MDHRGAVWASIVVAEPPKYAGMQFYGPCMHTANAPLPARSYDAIGFWARAAEVHGAAALWHAQVIFSHTLESVQGNARLAEASQAEEAAAALDATRKDVAIGGAGLAAQAIELDLVDELRMFRYPVVVGGGTPFLPPVIDDIALDLVETRKFGRA